VGYIHLYCTGPPSLHSHTRCTTKWTMLVKNPGENTCSYLHKVIQKSLCSRSISSCVSLVEHMPLKNADISTRDLTTLSGSDWSNAIGRSCCISTWLSWLFNPEIVRSLSRTHLEMFEAYPFRTLTFRRTFRKFSLSSFDIVWQAAGIYFLPFAAVNGCNLGLNPISYKSSRVARLLFVFHLMSKIVPSMLSMTFFSMCMTSRLC
jgi:hypothetical protein